MDNEISNKSCDIKLETEAPKAPIEAKVYFMPDLTIPLEFQAKIGFIYLCN